MKKQFISLSILAVLTAGCSTTQDTLYFGTATNLGLDISGTVGAPDHISLAYGRSEIAVIPPGCEGKAYPVAADLDYDVAFGSKTQLNQTFATGNAAEIVAKNAPGLQIDQSDIDRGNTDWCDFRPLTEKEIEPFQEIRKLEKEILDLRNMAETRTADQEEQLKEKTANMEKMIDKIYLDRRLTKSDANQDVGEGSAKMKSPALIFTTNSVHGIDLAYGQGSTAPNFTLGFRRIEAAAIPIADQTHQVRSVFADISVNTKDPKGTTLDEGVKAPYSTVDGVRIKQKFATGRAARLFAAGIAGQKLNQAVTGGYSPSEVASLKAAMTVKLNGMSEDQAKRVLKLLEAEEWYGKADNKPNDGTPPDPNDTKAYLKVEVLDFVAKAPNTMYLGDFNGIIDSVIATPDAATPVAPTTPAAPTIPGVPVVPAAPAGTG